jgi:membrane-associated phospholipid phosphatase
MKMIRLLGIVLALAAAPAQARDISWYEITITDVLTGTIPLGTLWRTYNIEDKAGRKQYLWSMGTTLVFINTARLALNDSKWGTRPNGSPYGFPSGHIAFVGASAAFLQERYGWAWGVPAWIATAYVAEVRIEDEHHRWRDVLASSAFAYGSAKYFVTRYPDTKVTPLFGEGGEVGLQVAYQFGGSGGTDR